MNPRLKILFISNSLFTMACNLLVPLYALFITQIGGGAELAGILFSLSFFSSTIFGLLVMKFKDKKLLSVHMLKASFLLRVFAWLMLAFYQSIPVLVVAQILNGASTAIGGSSFNSLVSENLDDKNHIKDWGIWEVIVNPAAAIGGLVSGFVLVYGGFQYVFLSMAILAAMSFITVSFYRRKISS